MKAKLLPVFLFIAALVNAQPNCQDTLYGNPPYVPINDLGTGTWNGFMGGLYPNGSNQIPVAFRDSGLSLACKIKPLDATGNVDNTNGKIVFISIGMSNATMEFSTFVPLGNADPLKGSKVSIVDCAEGGMSTDRISYASASFYGHYWDTTVVNRLASAAVTASQVQVIWYKEAYPVPTNLPPQTYSDSLRLQSKRIMNIIKSRFPNARICYLASRIYAGYASSPLNPEPYAYWQGWAMKWMIEDQINNDPMLRYYGSNANAPWLTWGTYNWANGTTPRSDGLTWLCSDYINDGTHPSTPGRQKVANKLLAFLDTAATACWYRTSPCPCTTGITEQEISDNAVKVFPNPFAGSVTISINKTIFDREKLISLYLYDVLGNMVKEIEYIPGNEFTLDMGGLAAGTYFYKIISRSAYLEISRGKLIAE